ncbi:hypothetical protein [Anaerotignum sp.]|uniref:hypothetical protein n=1 Tax=Anaerotignum sp. TaxID=2039241 RepID=UPI0028ABA7CA|nr:hypothetical protein [Anaerotignum sp.]
MNEKHIEMLKLIQSNCVDGKELDPTDIARLGTSFTMQEVQEAIPILEDDGLIEVIEIDMCCGVDYVVCGITEKGKVYLQSL